MSVVVIGPDKSNIQPTSDLNEVVRMTEELFSSAVAVEVMSDPEVPGESWTVLTVEPTGDPKELVQRRSEWHERLVRQFPDQFQDLRLSICPRI